jgi:hypothetical protein
MLNFLTVTQTLCHYLGNFVAGIVYNGFQAEENEQHEFLVLAFSILVILFLLYFVLKLALKLWKRFLNRFT